MSKTTRRAAVKSGTPPLSRTDESNTVCKMTPIKKEHTLILKTRLTRKKTLFKS